MLLLYFPCIVLVLMDLFVRIRILCKFCKTFKGLSSHCQTFLDLKSLWETRNLSKLLISVNKSGVFFFIDLWQNQLENCQNDKIKNKKLAFLTAYYILTKSFWNLIFHMASRFYLKYCISVTAQSQII